MSERLAAIRLDSGISLQADLWQPELSRAIVLFAHGSGSSRQSTRNRTVARSLNDAGLATMLMDLLTEEEAEDRANVFDIGLLSDRLTMALRFLRQDTETGHLRPGLFGASTGGAAAIAAAAREGNNVGAVVSRGGRPDLAGNALSSVSCPTLLIVGSRDREVLDLNQNALGHLTVEKRELAIVPGASHLFEEPGALTEVARLARDWFLRHLCQP